MTPRSEDRSSPTLFLRDQNRSLIPPFNKGCWARDHISRPGYIAFRLRERQVHNKQDLRLQEHRHLLRHEGRHDLVHLRRLNHSLFSRPTRLNLRTHHHLHSYFRLKRQLSAVTAQCNPAATQKNSISSSTAWCVTDRFA